MDRTAAVDRILAILDTIERGPVPVPIREVWVLGDVALGLDPIERVDLYIRKDMLFASDMSDPSREAEFEEEFGVSGIGSTVSAEWATTFPEHIETTAAGYAAPERCLAAQLVHDDEPIHLEICNASFEQNVKQRLKGAQATGTWEELLDPRAVCLWQDGTRSKTAPAKLRSGEYIFPPLGEALEMLGLAEEDAQTAVAAMQSYREAQTGMSLRSDVVSDI